MRGLAAFAVCAWVVTAASVQAGTCSVLVLDFNERGSVGQVDGAALADGLSSKLAALRQVDVIDRNDVMTALPASGFTLSQNDRRISVLKACRARGIDAVVNGTVIRDGKQVHLFVNVVSTRNGLAFEESVSGQLSDGLNALGDELVQKIVARAKAERQVLMDDSFSLLALGQEVAE